VTANAAECPYFPMRREPSEPLSPPSDLLAFRERCPMVRVRLWDGNLAWLVTRYADQRAVLADDRFSADVRRPGFPQSAPATATWFQRARPLMTMDNPEHDALRRSMAGAFTIRRVERLRPRVRQLVDELIDAMVAGGNPADLVTALALPLPSAVICELLGVPYTDHDFFVRTAGTVVSTSAPAEQSRDAIDQLLSYVADLITARCDAVRRDTEPVDDLLGSIVRDQYLGGRYTLEETAAIALQLLLAGHDTTAQMIALGVLALLLHPDQLALARDPDSAVPMANVVEELLRYLNVVHTGRRRVATEDVDVAGQVVRAGEGVVLSSDLGNRDPRSFDRPDELDVTRKVRHHLSFGYGVHQCLGAPLARMELQVAYATLFRRIPSLRLATDVASLNFREAAVVYGVAELPITWNTARGAL